MPINCLINSEQIVNNSCSKNKNFSPLMPINCLIKCLINSEQSCSNNQFMVNSWTIHEHSCFKKQPFRLSSFVSSSPFLSFPLFSSLFVSLSLRLFLLLSFPLFSSLLVSLSPLLSFFNVHSSWPANSLKTKDLRKRHFWLKILSQEKPLRLKKLGAKFAQYFAHFPADPTRHKPPKPPLHAPPRNPAQCRLPCRICRPNPTHLTPLIIKS